jgi:hypothetical protein
MKKIIAILALVALSSSAAARTVLIDGDTFDLDGERIRILNIDTPETFRSRCENELVLGLRAKQRLRQLLDSGPLTIVRENKDYWGRTLAYVLAGEQDVGEVLIREAMRFLTVKAPPRRRGGSHTGANHETDRTAFPSHGSGRRSRWRCLSGSAVAGLVAAFAQRSRPELGARLQRPARHETVSTSTPRRKSSAPSATAVKSRCRNGPPPEGVRALAVINHPPGVAPSGAVSYRSRSTARGCSCLALIWAYRLTALPAAHHLHRRDALSWSAVLPLPGDDDVLHRPVSRADGLARGRWY